MSQDDTLEQSLLTLRYFSEAFQEILWPQETNLDHFLSFSRGDAECTEWKNIKDSPVFSSASPRETAVIPISLQATELFKLL